MTIFHIKRRSEKGFQQVLKDFHKQPFNFGQIGNSNMKKWNAFFLNNQSLKFLKNVPKMLYFYSSNFIFGIFTVYLIQTKKGFFHGVQLQLEPCCAHAMIEATKITLMILTYINK